MGSHLNVPQETLGDMCLVQQNGQGGNVRIPLDEHRNRTKALQRLGVECSDGLSHGRAIVIDQHYLAICVVLGMPGQVDFIHRAHRHDAPTPRSLTSHDGTLRLRNASGNAPDSQERPTHGQAQRAPDAHAPDDWYLPSGWDWAEGRAS